MKLSPIALAALCTISFIACHKSSPDAAAVSSVDKPYFDKMLDVDSVSKDSIYTIFDYDALKRLTTIKYRNKIQTVLVYDFSYNGTEMLPLVTRSYFFGATDPEETWHQYNASGKLILDSVARPSDTGHIVYNTKNYTVKKYSSVNDTIFINTVRHALLQPGNTSSITTTIDKSKIDNSGNIMYTVSNAGIDTVQRAYSDKKSPFAKLNIFPSLRSSDSYSGDEFIQCPNLSASIAQHSKQSGIAVSRNIKQDQVSFNDGNYPIQAVITVVQAGTGGSTSYFNRYYYYKNL